MNNKFKELFKVKKPIIGMIHLAGNSIDEKIKRALEELNIYQNEGLDGAVVEDYHANGVELALALNKISEKNWNIKIGINYLRNPHLSFAMAEEHNANFIQLDNVDGQVDRYKERRASYPNLVILGGVRFKYQPLTGRTLDEDLEIGKQRADAIVTTGEGTGIETPIKKLREFKSLLRDYPLVSGAGVNLENIYEQLIIADCVIVGSYLKQESKTNLPVDYRRVKEIRLEVQRLR